MEQLYHIHVNNEFDELFKEGNKITIGNKPNNMRNVFLDSSFTYLDKVEMLEDGKRIYHWKDLEEVLKLDTFNALPVDKQLDVLLLLRAYAINSKMDFRELILEEVRKESFPDRPSRNTCIWLTDKECLPFWEKALHTDRKTHEIYKVETSGKIFVSTNKLLPVCHFKHKDQYEQAKHYWNPTEEDLKEPYREYLFEGELVLSERVK